MQTFFQHYSYFGLFAYLFAEEAGIPMPIPGDVFIAAVAAIPKSNYMLIVTTVVSATLIGSTVLFSLSRKFGQSFILKFGKYIRLTPEKTIKVEMWFEKYGGAGIVIGRLVPGLRIITPIVAGTFGVGYKTFWLYTTIAAFIWANIYFVIGKFFANILANFLR